MQHRPRTPYAQLSCMYFILILIAFVGLTAGILQRTKMREIPHCNEDVVLVGTGRFENGMWSGYECGPAVDDFIGG